MDNRKIDITSEGFDDLHLAMQLIWRNAPGGTAKLFRIDKFRPPENPYNHIEKAEDGTPTMILYWTNEGVNDALPLPCPMDLDGSVEVVKSWLKQVDYNDDHDIDGSVKKGWRVFTEQWGHVAGSAYAICAIQPVWALYGK
ncbi:hypothetical protein [Nitrosomonas marina]|uniref:Uncharacterized protein n=1 Tax=Nitrosomonas marina TaxID=917 RepID=A0A1H8IIN7_9PROT|nr:hypothetical protein [Nitrosomonas marina]SEN68142.1 hypothetical protein SAMN05216325_13313 [Nitrosomonas marina]